MTSSPRRRGRGHRARPTRAADEPCEDGAEGCEIEELFRVLGKSYTLEILHVFTREAPGPRRFVELQQRLSLSPNTLSDRLKELVGAGLLSRTAYNEIPPRVDYEATAKAHDLKPVFESLGEWATRHNLRPEPARERATPAATA